MRIIKSVQELSYFSKLSNIAIAKKLTVQEVIHLLKFVKNNPLSSVEARIEELKKMLIYVESELDEQKNVLFHYNEKIESVKLILKEWEKAYKR